MEVKTGTITVTSNAFAEGNKIPAKYTCTGQSISPELKWSGAPTSTQAWALIMEDPDAPSGTFTHWVLFNIPANTTELPEGAKNIGVEGQNSGRRNGYTGPCPPSGTHRYFFHLYALDGNLNWQAGATRQEVDSALAGHILGQGTLMGTYNK